MERIYQSGTHRDVSTFIGYEVEHTPAAGKKTLFIVGNVNLDVHNFHWSHDGMTTQRGLLPEFIASNAIEHVYLGANQSFPRDLTEWEWEPWVKMAKAILDLGLWVTLDIGVNQASALINTGLTQYHQFIPMISVKLPYLQRLGYNATIKLDDIDFAATNPGVWCHQLHDLQHRDQFTPWSSYTEDKILE